jgi:outer membrane protein TolC
MRSASPPKNAGRVARAEQPAVPIETAPSPDNPSDSSLPEPSVPPAEASDRAPEEPTPLPQKEIKLDSAPLEAGDMAFPINLATALRLSEARPLIVTAAQAGAWIAEAQLQRANLIWVPTLNGGANYIRHDGFGPDFNRGLNTAERPLNQNVNFLYTGVGVIMEFALTDAIFEPLAARQTLNSRRWDIQTAKNDALLATAKAYFDVHESRGKYAGAVDVVKRTELLVDRIGRLSEDLVPKVELARARRMLASAQQNAARKREKWRVASADLTQVLRLDPRVVVDPAEPDHLQITLIDPARPLDDLIPTGLTNRPELCSNRALVDAVAERIRRERGRILMPSILLNGFQTPNELIQVGAQGFGADSSLDLWSVRSDFSPQVVWKLEALGLGNLARIKEQRGEQSLAIVELFKVQDAVAAEVTRSQATLQSAAARVVEAERSLHEAVITFDGNYEGLAQTKRFGDVLVQAFRPQEAVIAVDELIASYDQYFSTVADYNRAQFAMYHAIGYPALELTDLHPPGDATPVDTSRPGYLPPVESGPPAATR